MPENVTHLCQQMLERQKTGSKVYALAAGPLLQNLLLRGTIDLLELILMLDEPLRADILNCSMKRQDILDRIERINFTKYITQFRTWTAYLVEVEDTAPLPDYEVGVRRSRVSLAPRA